MSEPNQFRHYQIVQDAEGNNVELVRDAEQVAVLAFDTQRLEFVHCHVLLQPQAERASFDDACARLRKNGHPLLGRLMDCGEDEGSPFYITSNVDGETLRAYLARQQEIPMWLAVMIACRALESAMALCERGDYMSELPMEAMRIVQTGPTAVQVTIADFRFADGRAARSRVLKANFERQAKFLRTFLQEQAGGGGPTAAETMLPAADFSELLGGCLTAMAGSIATQAKELRNALFKVAPEHLSGEIPTAQKPRPLVAPLLATYQDVARGVVNLVRIQSQRLDMANPYSMKGTLTRAGRQVWVEQVPPLRVCSARVEEADRQMMKLAKKRDFPGLVSVVLVNESDGITCVAEEVVDGLSLADFLRERKSLDPQESYLVMAGLDSVLLQLEKTTLGTRKLRLEDIYLMTGFAREDARTAKLMVTRVNEWPSFSITVRAHPSLASMSGRGADPGVLLPAQTADGRSPWNAGWMAALGRFLLGMEPLNGKVEGAMVGREREAVARMLDDELTKARDGIVSSRADFLGRYARVIQHYDLVKPMETAASAEASITELPPARGNGRPKTGALKPVAAKFKAEAALVMSPLVMAAPFGASSKPSGPAEKTAGFAELLFQSGRSQAVGTAAPDTQPDDDADDADWNPDPESVPMWLKAAVFIGGSMFLGGVLAHISGDAFWQKVALKPAAPGVAPAAPTVEKKNPGTVSRPVPKAIPVRDDEIDAPAFKIPEPPNLSLKPPAGANLRELITDQPGGSTTKK